MVTEATISSPFSEEEDLEQAWNKLMARLGNEASFNIPLDPGQAPSIEQITAMINPPKADSATKTTAKAIFSKTLKFIDSFGSMIAQGASVVFGPSNQVFNAVSFLIKVSQETQTVFDNLTALMDRLGVFLERLGMYCDQKDVDVKLDKNLRRSVYRVLEHFITIMAKSYQLTHSWRGIEEPHGLTGKFESMKARVKVAVKVGAFGDDSGIQDAMAKFENLIAEVSKVQIDEIHRGMSDAARRICSLSIEVHAMNTTMQESVALLQENSVIQGQNSTTLEQLRISDGDNKTKNTVMNALNIKSGEMESVLQTHGDFSNRTAGTGQWLFEYNDFQHWKDVRICKSTDNTYNVFSIQGPEGYGKSYLSHAVVDYLNGESRSEAKQLNMRVAWYDIPKEPKRNAVNQAFRYLIWQLAKDQAYLQFLHAVCKGYNMTDHQDTSVIWKQLVADYSKKRPGVTFFIVLDGVNRLDPDDRGPLRDVVDSIMSRQNNSEDLRIRLFLTGDSEGFESMRGIPNLALPSIDPLPSKNTPSEELKQHGDIKQFVTSRLDMIRIFHGMLPSEQEALRAKILERLLAAARGNYNTINRILYDIEVSDDLTQVEDVLNRVDEDSAQAIKREINALNERLGGQYIKQLNTIFMWIATARSPPDASLLSSALSMTFGESGLLKPVEYLKKNCSSLVDISKDEEVRFAPDAERSLRESDDRRLTVSEDEIRLIQAVLQTNFQRVFGDLDIYDKFDFKRFFEEKRNAEIDLVHLDPSEENAVRVLEACVTAVCDFYDSEKHQALRQYASRYFDKHIVDVNLDQVDSNLKQNIGQRLFRMLREDTVIDVWANTDEIMSMIDWFCDGNVFCETVVNWMKDPDVRKSILAVSTDIEWVTEVTSGKVAKEKVLQHVARCILQRWYKDDDDWPWRVVYWLRGYFQKAGPHADLYAQASSYDDASVQEIQDWEKWALTELQRQTDDAWFYFRMASVYNVSQMFAERHRSDEFLAIACARCDQAVKFDQNLWQAQMLRATILYSLREDRACIEQLEAIMSSHDSLLGKDEKYEKAYWDSLVGTMGDCHLRLAQFSTAATWYWRTFDHALEIKSFSETAEDHVCALVGALNKQGSISDALEILHRLNRNMQDGQSWLMKTLQKPYSDMHNHMVVLAHTLQLFSEMDILYDSVRENNLALEASGASLHLRFCRWRLRWFCGPLDIRGSCLNEMESIIRITKDENKEWSGFTRRSAVKELAHALRTMAMQARGNPTESQLHLDRLSGLSSDTSDMAARFWWKDVRLILGRCYHLAGDDDKAHKVLRPLVRKAIHLGKEDRTAAEGYEQLALILPVLDDDINALAAWSLLEPLREDKVERVAKTDAKYTEDSMNSSSEAQTASNLANGDELDGNTSHDPNSTIEQGTIPDVSSAAIPVDSRPPKLKGQSYFSCNGGCDRNWSYADDIWTCRDCFETQFDQQCYEKLKAGQLDVLTCHQDHKHLHIPKFDEKAWRAQDPESVKVGSEVMKRKRWLTELGKQWDIDSLERAVIFIERWKKIWLLRRKIEANQQDASKPTVSNSALRSVSPQGPS
ncbi:MAG: hypothetical protein Q9157_006608 [Trypethelium eluteriae]